MLVLKHKRSLLTINLIEATLKFSLNEFTSVVSASNSIQIYSAIVLMILLAAALISKNAFTYKTMIF